jgi:integrase/recombinase XerD
MTQGFAETFSLYSPGASRKYLNAAERQRALAATAILPITQALFALTLAWTGARPSEVLALTPSSFQIDCGIVAFQTLKRRKHWVREVPIPPWLMSALEREYSLQVAQRSPEGAMQRLWPWSRVTAWRVVKKIMGHAGLSGRAACPRGLRHSFGVGTLQSGVPVTTLQKWLGHSRLASTAIYANASGPEDQAFAACFWRRTRHEGFIRRILARCNEYILGWWSDILD